MKVTVVLIFIVLTNSLFAQNWDWVNHLTGGGSNHAYFDIEVSGDNIYAVGRYRAPAVFFGQDSNIDYPYWAGGRDAFITKLDTAGNYLWVNTEGGPSTEYGYGVTVDEYDNAYMIGITYDTAYFGNQQLISHNGFSSMYVAKYSPLGDLIWAKNWEGTGNDSGLNIECDKSGSIYISGYQGGEFDFDLDTIHNRGLFVGKLDYDGNYIWCKGPKSNSPGSSSSAMALNLYNNHIYIGGKFSQQVGLGLDTISTPGSWSNMFFSKLDTNGNFIWSRQASSLNHSDCRDIAILDSSIYVVGSYSGTTVFDTISLFSEQIGLSGGQALNSQDAFLAKYNFDGSSCYWIKEQKSLYFDVSYKVKTNRHKNIVVVGAYAFSWQGNVGDLRISEYSENGNLIWEHSPNGNLTLAATALDIGPNSNYYIGGQQRGSYSFPPDINLAVSNSKYSAIIGKMYPPLTTKDSTLAICQNDSIWITLPNVNGSPLNYQWHLNNQVFSSNNDSIFVNPINLDSIWCIVSNNAQTDTSIFYFDNNSFTINLGQDTTTCDFQTSIELSTPNTYSDYSWSTGETTNNITINQSGSYFVNVTNSYDCNATDTVNVSFVDCTTINEKEKNLLKINISNNNMINISTNDIYFTLELYTINGQLIKRYKNQLCIDLRDSTIGMYILKYNGSIIENKKIIIR